MQLLAVPLSHSHHVYTARVHFQSLLVLLMPSFTTNSSGYVAHVDTHLKGERWFLFWVRLQVHIYLVYEMEIPTSTAAAASKLTTAFHKQLPFIEAIC